MVGFVAGLPFLYQWSNASGSSRREISAPAHRHAQAHGRAWRLFQLHLLGARAGGYQMFGITPMPIYDPNQKISYLRDFMCLFSRATS